MKDKRFLTGLGLGLIIGTVLLQLMNIANLGSDNTLLSNRDEDKGFTQQEVNEMIRTALEKAQINTEKVPEASPDVIPVADLDINSESNNQTQSAVEQEISDNTETPNPQYSITIKPGMSSDQAAEALFEAMLIEDKTLFIKELSHRKLANKIQVGTFLFKKLPTLNELIERLTKA